MQSLAQLLPIILLFVVFYFFLIRPQQKRQKEALAMQSSLAKGDKIVTIGGMHGVIDKVEDGKVVILCPDSSRLTFDISAVREVVQKTEG